MRSQIIEKLQDIETSYEVRILYACESGSRAWGFPSLNSDYDVRVIYIHKPEWYLSIDNRRDTIEYQLDEVYDILGWDLKKSLALLRVSNPTLLEWLDSPVVYKSESRFFDKMSNFRQSYCSVPTCFMAYKNGFEQKFKESSANELIGFKNYFYILRPLLACKWLLKNSTPAPMLFKTLLDEFLPEGIERVEIDKLLELKLNSEEMGEGLRNPFIDEYISKEILELTDIKFPKVTAQKSFEELNRFFIEMLYDSYPAGLKS